MARERQNYTILSGETSIGPGVTIKSEDYNNIILAVASDGGGDADMTLQLQGSISIDSPNFNAAQSKDNLWAYIAFSDYTDGEPATGDEGIIFSGGDKYKIIEAEINGLKWFTVNMTARSAGEPYVYCKLFN